MSDLPTRSRQHIIEKKSLDILNSILPKEWIIRHQSTDDYGIDLEIEIVYPDGSVPGTFFKAQVKGTENLSVNANGEITISGIKQTTLKYWINLNRHIHVIIFYVDIINEKIYWAPVFWQSCKLIDGSGSTKTVKFYHQLEKDPKSLIQLILNVVVENHYTRIHSFKWFIINFEKINEFVDWCDGADWGSLVDDAFFRMLLDEIRILCEEHTISKDAPTLKYNHWYNESVKKAGDAVANFIAKIPIDYYLPILINNIEQIRISIIESKYYWERKDQTMYDLVSRLSPLENNTKEYMIKWVEKNSRHIGTWL